MDKTEAALQPRLRLQIHQDFIGGLVSLKGELFTASEDGELLWTDLEERSSTPMLEGRQPLNYLVLFQEEILLACCDDGNIYCHHLTDESEDNVLRGLDSSGVRKVAVSFDGKVIAGTNSGQIGIWSNVQGSEPPTLFDVHHGVTVNAVCVHPSRPLAATAGMDGMILIWDLNALQVIRELEPVQGEFICGASHFGASQMLWNQDYLFVGNQDVHIYNVNFDKVQVLDGFSYAINDLAVHGNTLYVLGGGLKTWVLHSWEPGPSISLPLNPYSLALSEDGGRLYVGMARGIVYAYETSGWNALEPEVEHYGNLNGTLVTEDYLFTCAQDRQIIVWDRQGKCQFKIKAEHNYVSLLTCYQGELLYFDDRKLHWYDLEKRRVVRTLATEVFSVEDAVRVGQEMYITSVGHYPVKLNLDHKTLTDLPFRFALYEMQKLGDQLFYTGYTSYAQSPEEHPGAWEGENIGEGEKPNEAPMVQYDLSKGAYTHEYWLHEAPGYSSYSAGTPRIYPTCFARQGGDLLVGYTHGKVARWCPGQPQPLLLKTLGHKPNLIPSVNANYTRSITQNAAGNYLVSNSDVVLVDEDLSELGRFTQKNSVTISHYDSQHNLILVYQHYNYRLYFMDALTLEVYREEKISSYVDEVLQVGDCYMVFCNGRLHRFAWEGKATDL